MATPPVRSLLDWYLCDLVTGKILTDVPIEATGTATCVLYQADTTTVNLLIADKTCPPNWAELLVPGIPRMLVCCVAGMPAQAWWVTSTKRGRAQTDRVPLSLTTLEALVSTVNVPDLDYSGGGEPVTIAAALATTQALVTLDDGSSVLLASLTTRFGFALETTAGTDSTTVTYDSTTNTNVLSSWESLRTANLLEYRFLTRWSDSTKTAFSKVIQIATRIGSTRPNAILEIDASGNGTIADYSVETNSSNAATLVVGATDGIGGGRTYGAPQVSPTILTAGYPVVELRETYSDLADSVDVTAAVTARAAASLAAHQQGTTTFTFQAHKDSPKLGTDYDAGDTVPLDLKPSTGDPIGASGVVRLLGADLDLSTGIFHPRVWQDPADN